MMYRHSGAHQRDLFMQNLEDLLSAGEEYDVLAISAGFDAMKGGPIYHNISYTFSRYHKDMGHSFQSFLHAWALQLHNYFLVCVFA